MLQGFEILPIPVLKDNYAYLLIDRIQHKAALVDPVEPQKVVAFLKQQWKQDALANQPPFTIESILTTHHHWDHASGNPEICQQFPSIQVYGFDERVTSLTRAVKHNETIQLGSLSIQCLHTPCHTSGSVCYFIPGVTPAVFTGDTLFVGGCGRFFEGTAQLMYNALIKTLGSLPKETLVYCGHEYTRANLKFAQSVEPDNPHIRDKLQWSMQQECTIPSTIEQEFLTNPFMRVDEPLVQKHTHTHTSIDTMHQLRELKNKF